MTGPMDTRNRSTLFRGLVVDVEQMEVRIGAKGWHVFQVVRHPGGVGILPLHDDGTVTLIRQLRPAVGRTDPRDPRGEAEARGGPGRMRPAGAGRGDRPHRGNDPAAGIFLPVARRLRRGDPPVPRHRPLRRALADPEHYEEIETVRIPLEEALRMAGNDDGIRDGKTIVALLRARCLAP